MADIDWFDWVHSLISAVVTYGAIEYGKWLQRRRDRRGRRRG